MNYTKPLLTIYKYLWIKTIQNILHQTSYNNSNYGKLFNKPIEFYNKPAGEELECRAMGADRTSRAYY